MQALIDNLIERGLDPRVCRLFIIDGAKALSKIIRRTFGRPHADPHKARNLIERLPKPLHASVRRALRQAWERDDADKAERNVKQWRNAAMALRWTAAGMMEAAKGFRRLKAYKLLHVLRAALAAHQSNYVTQRVEHDADAA